MFYITISNGLLERKHYRAMGAAVWQFMWLIDKVTKIDEEGVGWVLGGKPVNLKDIAMGVTEDAASRNLQKLARAGYIRIERKPYGLVIYVAKAKKRFGKNVESLRENIGSGSGINVESLGEYKDDNISTDNGSRHSAAGGTAAEWSLESKLREMESGKRRDMQVLALYYRARDAAFENPAQLSAGIRRDIRAAQKLAGYSNERIAKTTGWLSKNTDFKWTLETVHKYIDEDLRRLEKPKEIVHIRS